MPNDNSANQQIPDDRSAFQIPPNLTIVAVGGCGKRLVNQICEQHEWFLKEYIRDARKSLKFEVFDTDSNQRKEDTERENKINEIFSELKAETAGLQGTLTYKYYHIPDLAHVGSISSLTSDDVVGAIKNSTTGPKVPFWWLHDAEHNWQYSDLKQIDPDFDDEFGGGVHRRRALSKAVFYKAISQANQNMPSFTGKNFAIVVGLGGGSGSGMFIDLARYIRNRSPDALIWLFAILPAESESEKNKLNAAIALTELEYLKVTETDPTNKKLFNYVIVSSLGPTKYREGHTDLPELQDFDKAFPYILINMLYLPISDIREVIEKSKHYTGFIFADAHVIEYPIEELQKLKSDYLAVLKKYNAITDTQQQLTDKAGRIFSEISGKYLDLYDVNGGADITEEDVTTLKTEIQSVFDILFCKMTGNLKYKTPEKISDYIENNVPKFFETFIKPLQEGKKDNEIKDIKKYSDLVEGIDKILKNAVNLPEPVSPKDDNDKNLYRAVKQSMERIVLFADYQKKTANIRDELTRKAFRGVLKGEEKLESLTSDITAIIQSLDGQIAELDKQVTQVLARTHEINTQKLTISGTADIKVTGLSTPITTYLDQKKTTENIKVNEPSIKERFDSIQISLKQTQIKAQEKVPPSISKTQLDRDSDIAGFERLLDQTITDPVLVTKKQNLKLLAQKLTDYYLHTYQLTLILKAKTDRENQGRFGRIIRDGIEIILGKDQDEAMEASLRNKCRADENHIRQLLESWNGSITLRGNSVEAIDINPGFLSTESEMKAQKIRDDQIITVSEDLGIVGSERETLKLCYEKKTHKEISDDLKFTISGILSKHEQIDQKEEQNKNELVEINAKRDELNRKKGLYTDVEKFIKDTEQLRRKYKTDRSGDKGYDNALKAINDTQHLKFQARKGEYRTRLGEINPEALAAVEQSPRKDLSALSLTDAGLHEITSLVGAVDEQAKYLLEPKKLGLDKNFIQFRNNAWSPLSAVMAINTPSEEITRWVVQHNDDFTTNISEKFQVDKNKAAKIKPHTYGKPWEIALTFYITASFLDNVAPLLSGGGYWEEYKNAKDNVLHHVLLMQNGQYISRSRLLDQEIAAELAFLEREDKNRRQVDEEIKALYTVKSIKDAIPK